MSLILDALKKSEAERLRGQVPTLLSPLPSVVGNTISQNKYWRSKMIFITLLIILFLFVLSTAAYLYMKMLAAKSPSVEPAPTNQSAEQTNRPKPVEIPALAPIVVVPMPIPIPIEKPVAPITTIAAPLPAPPLIKPQATPAPLASAAIIMQVGPETLIASLSELPTEQRQQLPALKLSMHVFSAEASKRFAIIDGQRVNEGSVLGTAVVEQIRQDGVVLSVQGQSYLLPRP